MAVRLRHGLTAAALLALMWGHMPEAVWLLGVALLNLFRGASPRQGFYAGAMLGLGPAVCMSGFVHAGWRVAVAMLISYVLVKALMGLTIAFVARRLSQRSMLFALPWLVACVWTLADAAHAAIPYNAPDVLGASQWRGPLLWLAPLGGAPLITFFSLYASMALAVWMNTRRTIYAWPLVLSFIVLGSIGVGRSAGFGVTERVQGADLQVGVVQGGLSTADYAGAVPDPLGFYMNLSRRLRLRYPHLDFEVWPETATGLVVGEQPRNEQRLQEFLEDPSREGSLWFGAVVRDAVGSYRNGALIIGDERVHTASERVPYFENAYFLGKMRLALLAEAYLSPVTERPLVFVEHDRAQRSNAIGVLFCLETIDATAARALTRAGAEALVVLAESGRFDGGIVGPIHFRHSIVRAAEVGRALLHAGQHGFTSLILPDGTVPFSPWGVFNAAVGKFELPLYAGLTPYVRYGPWPVPMSALVVLILFGRGLWSRRRNGESLQTSIC